MQKLSSIFNLFCISAVLLSSLALQGMKDFANFDRGKFVDVVCNNDAQVVEEMLQCCVTEKEKQFAGSHFDDVKTVEMAQLFIAYDCFQFFCAKANRNYVYLESMCDIFYPVELMKFSFEHGVSPKSTTAYGKRNLLHIIASIYLPENIEDKDVKNFLAKATYLLTLIPDKINEVSIYNQTPLGEATESLKQARNEKAIAAFEQIIRLFQENGAH